jgi:hypothetical protein
VATVSAPQVPALSLPRYLRFDGAAAYLTVGERSLRDPRWRAKHGVPHARLSGGVIVFDRLALDAWIAQRQTNGRRLARRKAASRIGSAAR